MKSLCLAFCVIYICSWDLASGAVIKKKRNLFGDYFYGDFDNQAIAPQLFPLFNPQPSFYSEPLPVFPYISAPLYPNFFDQSQFLPQSPFLPTNLDPETAKAFFKALYKDLPKIETKDTSKGVSKDLSKSSPIDAPKESIAKAAPTSSESDLPIDAPVESSSTTTTEKASDDSEKNNDIVNVLKEDN